MIYLSIWSLITHKYVRLQGSFQYALYKDYGYSLREIALFYVVGFGSSGLIGTRIASLADDW